MLTSQLGTRGSGPTSLEGKTGIFNFTALKRRTQLATYFSCDVHARKTYSIHYNTLLAIFVECLRNQQFLP